MDGGETSRILHEIRADVRAIKDTLAAQGDRLRTIEALLIANAQTGMFELDPIPGTLRGLDQRVHKLEEAETLQEGYQCVR